MATIGRAVNQPDMGGAGDRESVDFDHHDLAWLASRHRHNDELRDRCPVVWNERYGFWYVTGYDEVVRVAKDSTTFSPRYTPEPTPADGIRYIGIMGIPRDEALPPVGIAEAGGPTHVALRRLINPFMLPPAVERDRPFIRQASSWFLDQKIEDGEMDMVLDLTNPVPAVLTMRLMGLPAERWPYYAEFFHGAAAYEPGSPEYERSVEHAPEMMAQLLEEATRRRTAPGDDLLSKLVLLEVEGSRLTDEDMIAVIFNLIGGGLDTTTSLTSLALYHLDEHPDLREQLVADPTLLEAACEEYLRWTSVNETLTRTCTTGTVLGGQRIEKGEYVMMSWLGANYDPLAFPDPYEVRFDRAPNEHVAFGVGAHRCLGLHVARALFVETMREVLTRIPDYRVDRAATRFYQGNPELHGVVRMPVTFTPGPRAGVERPF